MPRLGEYFDALGEIEPPANWAELESLNQRTLGGPAPSGRGSIPDGPRQGYRRALSAALAITISAAGLALAIWVFRGAPGPATRPTPVVENGLIAFVATGHGNSKYEIFAVMPDGSGLTKLVEGRDPSWSPDGRMLAYASNEPNIRIRVVIRDLTAATSTVGGPKNSQSPSWSPSGSRIAFALHDGIYVMNEDGSGIHRVGGYDGPGACADFDPSWSPDGNTIAWAVRCDGGGLGIWTVRSNGSGQSVLVGEGSGLIGFSHPTWSPDGTHIAFEGWRRTFGDAIGPTLETKIYVVDVDGSGLTDLAEGREPVWSPDGSLIGFVRDFDLYLMNEAGSIVTRVTSNGLVSGGLAWQALSASDPFGSG